MTVVEQIVNQEIPGVIVYESDTVVAFMSHEPFNPGHVLISPKVRYPSLIDIPEDIHAELMQVTRKLYDRIMKKYQPDGISLMQNNGKFNDLDHYHLHIFPRYENDGFGWTYNYDGIHPQEKLRAEAEGLAFEDTEF